MGTENKKQNKNKKVMFAHKTCSTVKTALTHFSLHRLFPFPGEDEPSIVKTGGPHETIIRTETSHLLFFNMLSFLYYIISSINFKFVFASVTALTQTIIFIYTTVYVSLYLFCLRLFILFISVSLIFIYVHDLWSLNLVYAYCVFYYHFYCVMYDLTEFWISIFRIIDVQIRTLQPLLHPDPTYNYFVKYLLHFYALITLIPFCFSTFIIQVRKSTPLSDIITIPLMFMNFKPAPHPSLPVDVPIHLQKREVKRLKPNVQLHPSLPAEFPLLADYGFEEHVYAEEYDDELPPLAHTSDFSDDDSILSSIQSDEIIEMYAQIRNLARIEQFQGWIDDGDHALVERGVTIVNSLVYGDFNITSQNYHTTTGRNWRIWLGGGLVPCPVKPLVTVYELRSRRLDLIPIPSHACIALYGLVDPPVLLQARKALRRIIRRGEEYTYNEIDNLEKALRELRILKDKRTRDREETIRLARYTKSARVRFGDDGWPASNVDQAIKKQAFLSSTLSGAKDMFVAGNFDLPIFVMNLYNSQNVVQIIANMSLIIRDLDLSLSPLDLISHYNDLCVFIEIAKDEWYRPDDLYKQARRTHRGDEPPSGTPDINIACDSFFYKHFHITSSRQAFFILASMVSLLVIKDTNLRSIITTSRSYIMGKEINAWSIVEHVLTYTAHQFTTFFSGVVEDLEFETMRLLRKNAEYELVTKDGIKYQWQYFPAYACELEGMRDKLATYLAHNSNLDSYTIARYRVLINLVNTQIESARKECVTRRVEPCIIGIYGSPSMGKTCITKIMADLATRCMGLGCLDEYSTFFSDVADKKFTTNKQGIVYFWDDLGMAEEGQAYGQIMTFANNLPSTFASAIAEQKGNFKANGILGIATSNAEDFGVQTSGLLHPSAFMRRFDFVIEMRVKEEYCALASNGEISTTLNTQKFLNDTIVTPDGLKVTPDAWIFIIKKVFVLGDTWRYETLSTFETCQSFFSWYVDAFRNNRLKKSRALANQMDTKFCQKCGLPASCHHVSGSCVAPNNYIDELNRAQGNRHVSSTAFSADNTTLSPTPMDPCCTIRKRVDVPSSLVLESEEPMVESWLYTTRKLLEPGPQLQTYKRRVFGQEIEVNTFKEIIAAIFMIILRYILFLIALRLLDFLCYSFVVFTSLPERIKSATNSIFNEPEVSVVYTEVESETEPYGGKIWFKALYEKVPLCQREFLVLFSEKWKRVSTKFKLLIGSIIALGLVKGAHTLYKALFVRPDFVAPVVNKQMWKECNGERLLYPAFRNYANNVTRKFVDFANESVYQYALFDSYDDLLAWRAGEIITHTNGTGFFVSGKIFAYCKHSTMKGKWLHFFPRDMSNDCVCPDQLIDDECIFSAPDSDWEFSYISGAVSRPDLLSLSLDVDIRTAEQQDIVFLFDEVRTDDIVYYVRMILPTTGAVGNGILNYTVPGGTQDGHSGSLFLRVQGNKYALFHHEGLTAKGHAFASIFPMNSYEYFKSNLRTMGLCIDPTLSTDLTPLMSQVTLVTPKSNNPLEKYTGLCGLALGASATVVPVGKPKEVMKRTCLYPHFEKHFDKQFVSPSDAKQLIYDEENSQYYMCSPYDVRLSLTGNAQPIDTRFVWLATDEYIDRLKTHLSDRNRLPPFTIDEVVNGVPDIHLRPINRNTSSGFGRSGPKKNYMNFIDHRWSFDDDTVSKIERYLSVLKTGKVEGVVVKSSIKMDEVISEKKLKSGKSRQVYTMNLEYLVLSKMYLGPILTVMGENQAIFECMVGINATSSDWENLRQLLHKKGYTQFSSMDFSSFDINIIGIFMEHACRVFLWVAKYICKYTDEELLITSCILVAAMQPFLLYRNHFRAMSTSEFSGHCATAQINSILNSIYQRCAWFYALYLLGIDMLTKYDNNWSFDKHNTNGVYGDDIVVARSDPAVAKISGTLIRDSFAYFGQIVTDVSDKSLPPRFTNFDEMRFLKRAWRPVTWYDYEFMSAPLEEESIYKMMSFNGESKTCLSDEILQQTIENAIREMWLHGPERFYSFCDEIEPLCDKYNIVPRVGRSSAQLWAHKMEKNEFASWEEEQWFFHL